MKRLRRNLPWLLLAGVMLLSAWAVRAADRERVIQVLTRGDLAVLELYLHHQGHRVRVASGVLMQKTPEELVARLECRTEAGGLEFTWDYPLGGDTKATLAGR